ncbi:MAG: hypothetical protein EPN82_06030 [Bacteroidetes bacterium]|nr:MAG: hypothetical protein EPN82_06030 [Bacteroidota bacterium]
MKTEIIFLYMFLFYLNAFAQPNRTGLFSTDLDSISKNTIPLLTSSDFNFNKRSHKLNLIEQTTRQSLGLLSFPDSLYPTALVAGDLDSNGISDIVIGFGEVGRVFIYWNGSTSYTEIMKVNNDNNFGAILSNGSDIDGDGIQDLFIGGSIKDTLYLLKGNINQNSTISKLYISINDRNISSPIQIIGKVDTNYKIAVGYPLFSMPDQQECGKVTIFKYSNSSLSVDTIHYGKEAFAYFGSKLSSCDVDGDNIPDLVVSAPYQNKFGAFYVYNMMNDSCTYLKQGNGTDSRFGNTILAVDYQEAKVGGIAISAFKNDSTATQHEGVIYWYRLKQGNGNSIGDTVITGFDENGLSGWSLCFLRKSMDTDSSAILYTTPFSTDTSSLAIFGIFNLFIPTLTIKTFPENKGLVYYSDDTAYINNQSFKITIQQQQKIEIKVLDTLQFSKKDTMVYIFSGFVRSDSLADTIRINPYKFTAKNGLIIYVVFKSDNKNQILYFSSIPNDTVGLIADVQKSNLATETIHFPYDSTWNFKDSVCIIHTVSDTTLLYKRLQSQEIWRNYKFKFWIIDNDTTYKNLDTINRNQNFVNIIAKYDTTTKIVSVDEQVNIVQNQPEIISAIPNPFTNNLKLIYKMPVDCKIIIELYDVTGEKVATLYNGLAYSGLNSNDFELREVAQGDYSIVLKTNMGLVSRKAIKIK